MAHTNVAEANQLLQGNHACVLGAVAAGCRFYAGYPITPSSEIAEGMAAELPKVNGVFVQMEDEIASMAAVVGASLGGVKAMTATSGPGFSLKQENLGFAAMTEIPCVIVNVMRGGPSTGLPTRPGQGDFMQARWGTHGDHPVIVLVPYSVGEIYSETVRAFNLAEQFRVPVVILYDEIIGHLRETAALPDQASLEIVERPWATGTREGFLPYADSANGVPFMARPGEGYRTHTTGLTHGPDGFPTQNPAQISRSIQRLLNKLKIGKSVIEVAHLESTEDAEVLVVGVGIVGRAAERAVRLARQQGIRAGLFRPVTLWPFPEQAFQEATRSARSVLVAEMNAGQLVHEIQRLSDRPVAALNRVDGEPIPPQDILDRLKTLVSRD
jgi:2-oxoglutarate ferredoxin oxidoreductase subunit alpha